MRPESRNNFAVAIICALSLEVDAVEALFDEIYDRLGKHYGKQQGDANEYINGRIGKHDVVLCYVPGMGKGSTASVASSLQVSYTGIKLALIVGICAGAPSPPNYGDIFLGDVIISDSVFEYDFGRQYPDGFQRKTTIKHRPDREIRTLLSGLRMENARHEFQNQMLQYLHAIQQTGMQWHRPQKNDILFRPSYVHKHSTEASSPNCCCLMTDSPDFICEDNSEVIRCRKPLDAKVSAYFGTLASSDIMVKSGNLRDAITNEEGILGFDMERVGIWPSIKCIMIKGVCDYADDHKSKAWQKYAAATGASAAKSFLDYWPPGSGFQDIENEISDEIEYTESPEKEWNHRLTIRKMNNKCLNCGFSGHCETTCYFDCGRCREGGHTQRYCHNDFKPSSDDGDFAENGEERWDSILRSRIQNKECFNCGDAGHYEPSCHLNCNRCQESGHTQRNCPYRFKSAEGYHKAQSDSDLKERFERIPEANLTNASIKTKKVAEHSPEQLHEFNIDEHSVGSSIVSTIFDESGRTRQTLSSAGTALHDRRTAGATSLFHGPTVSPREISLNSSAGNECFDPDEDVSQDSKHEQYYGTDDFDTETTCSIDSNPENQKFCYMRAFAAQLNHDLKCDLERLDISNIDSSYLSSAMKAFAWKLHGESSNPFEWEASATLRQKQTEIIDLLIPAEDQTDGEGNELPRSPSFKKPQNLVSNWIDNVEDSTPAEEDTDINDNFPDDIEHFFLPELPSYEKFIRKSDAYQWLLLKLRQHGQLPSNKFTTVSELGRTVLERSRVLEPLRKISRRRGSLLTIKIELDRRLMSYFNDIEFTSSDAFPESVLCLTGIPSEAQATTVIEYFQQTWPVSGEHTIKMIKQLRNLPRAQDFIYHLPGPKDAKISARIEPSSQCSISITGSIYLVAEIVEQIGWLIAGLQTSPTSQEIVTCCPRIENLDVRVADRRTSDVVVVGSCRILFDIEDMREERKSAGFCWGPLFSNITLIGGYPIPLRPNANTGLEISLGTMAYLVNSQQVVQWGIRILIKGFNSLLIATSATDSITVWHLFVNKCPDERISYVDRRLETIESTISEKHSLRFLEQTRHIVGWCSNITDFCGHSMAPKAISGCGLPRPPPDVVIDRLYIEAGSEVVAGLNIGLNKRNQPVWLKREDDYPSFLKWISHQAIIFYDVSEHRAWLVDGASALLYLLRASIYLDENDPESTYEWVFDIRELKDAWEGCSGRFAALKTLKHPKNLELKLYVKNPGNPVLQYTTLRERVSKIMHSLETLVDSQTKASSQDGIRISQTLKLQKGISGFDILDIISPLGPIHPRMKHLSYLGPGWVDFIPSLEAITIFGNGFGDLIRPNDPNSVCCDWKSIPTDKEYMAASVSTVKMLYKKRLYRNAPDLGLGELTSKIIWTSESNPFKPCGCLRDQRVGVYCHLNPVQYLIPKSSWRSSIISKHLAPVDLDQLEEKGAVVFGHLSFRGKVKEENKDNRMVRKGPSSFEGRSSSHGNTGGSTITSIESQSTRSTDITQPSLDSSFRKGTVKVRDSNLGKEDKNHTSKRTRVVWGLLRKLPGFRKEDVADSGTA